MNLKDINMDKLQSIEPGTVFRNRRDLCKYLEVSYLPTGQSSKRQKERINYLFSYIQTGHKIEVAEVYPEEVIAANYDLSRSDQGKLVEAMILKLIEDHMQDSPDSRLVVSLNSLIAALALANSEYFNHYYKGEKTLVKDLGFDENRMSAVSKWLRSTRASFQYVIDTALKNLSDRRLIDVGPAYKYKDSRTREIKVAGAEEHGIILNIERKALYELGFTKIGEVFAYNKVAAFDKITSSMSKELLNADFFFKCYGITFATEAFSNLFSDASWEENQLAMNGMMLKRLTANIENKYKRNYKEDEGFNIVTSDEIKDSEFQLLEYLVAIYSLEDDLGSSLFEVCPVVV